jgi:hypothetical protein
VRRSRGYGVITKRVPGKKNPQGFFAHREMAKVVLGRDLHPDLETIEHACEIPWCINPWHLDMGSRADNTADMRARRSGKPRKTFRPLLDPALYYLDTLADRCFPRLRAELELDTADCPF